MVKTKWQLPLVELTIVTIDRVHASMTAGWQVLEVTKGTGLMKQTHKQHYIIVCL